MSDAQEKNKFTRRDAIYSYDAWIKRCEGEFEPSISDAYIEGWLARDRDSKTNEILPDAEPKQDSPFADVPGTDELIKRAARLHMKTEIDQQRQAQTDAERKKQAEQARIAWYTAACERVSRTPDKIEQGMQGRICWHDAVKWADDNPKTNAAPDTRSNYRLLKENKALMRIADEWMHECDRLKAKYEPTEAVLSETNAARVGLSPTRTMVILASEYERILNEIIILESRASQFESTLKETMRVRDEALAKLKVDQEARAAPSSDAEAMEAAFVNQFGKRSDYTTDTALNKYDYNHGAYIAGWKAARAAQADDAVEKARADFWARQAKGVQADSVTVSREEWAEIQWRMEDGQYKKAYELMQAAERKQK